MQFLFALFIKFIAFIKKVIAFLSKEFFLLFIYCVIGSILTLFLWLLLVYGFRNKEIYEHLYAELNGSTKLVIAFLYALSLGCIYLYRLLLAAVKGAVLK